jgi:hypothetical protein
MCRRLISGRTVLINHDLFCEQVLQQHCGKQLYDQRAAAADQKWSARAMSNFRYNLQYGSVHSAPTTADNKTMTMAEYIYLGIAGVFIAGCVYFIYSERTAATNQTKLLKSIADSAEKIAASTQTKL